MSNKDKFDILKDEFKDWELDENGVTNLVEEEIEGDSLWVVYIDMHT